ncbi:hypothetical protein Tco_0736424 [Tanacetum coccineum]
MSSPQELWTGEKQGHRNMGYHVRGYCPDVRRGGYVLSSAWSTRSGRFGARFARGDGNGYGVLRWLARGRKGVAVESVVARSHEFWYRVSRGLGFPDFVVGLCFVSCERVEKKCSWPKCRPWAVRSGGMGGGLGRMRVIRIRFPRVEGTYPESTSGGIGGADASVGCGAREPHIFATLKENPT